MLVSSWCLRNQARGEVGEAWCWSPSTAPPLDGRCWRPSAAVAADDRAAARSRRRRPRSPGQMMAPSTTAPASMRRPRPTTDSGAMRAPASTTTSSSMKHGPSIVAPALDARAGGDTHARGAGWSRNGAAGKRPVQDVVVHLEVFLGRADVDPVALVVVGHERLAALDRATGSTCARSTTARRRECGRRCRARARRCRR